MLIKLNTGKILDIAEGETLQNALKRQGIYLVASCGGKGTCGKCKVRILEGGFRTLSTAKLQPGEIDRGVVLACQTYADEDITLDIPKESMLVVGDVIEIARSQDLFELFGTSDGKISPIVEWIDLDLPSPTLDNNMSDLERLKNSLEEAGLKGLRFSHPFVASLSRDLRDSGWKIKLGHTRESAACFLKPCDRTGRYGIAVDIGTTTMVLYLVNLDDGNIIDVGSTYNSQIRHGDDVITRIVYATEGGGLEELRENVVSDISSLLNPLLERHDISDRGIESAVVAGNTTMTHLFWGIDPQFIREEPYTPTINSFPLWTAGTARLPINNNAPVYTFPCIASYVGGDIVAGVLASRLHRSNDLSLFLDIGTNGEIVLGNREWLVTAACSAGPCFEGSGIRHGMRATEGAVESVKIAPRTYEPELGVIGHGKPVGICGSGMIDAITEMFLTGIIDQKGRIIKNAASGRIRDGVEGPEFVFYSDGRSEVVLTEVDIENIIRAKAAIFAGVSLLLRETGFTLGDLEHVYIAGGFGNYLNVGKAILIGMLPDIPREKFRFLGNTSIVGAYLCLLSENMRRDAEEIAKKMTNIELSVSRNFMDEYLSALFLPHTDISLFPTVEEILKSRK
ncbi:MAG TPA: ASKHA domain-containing protein [Thermodesulfovibrionales bacterium]|nr:ASKHA domain-containing protein [Thermodesulfovibrionales bacterium]